MNFRKNSFLILLILIISIALMSCASTPTETEVQAETEVEPVVEEKTITEVSTPPEAEPEVSIYFAKMTEAKKSADDSKAAADKVRAGKGDPGGYKAAEAFYAKALAAQEKEEFETSAETYGQANEAYLSAITRTEENRQAALKAMQAMDNAIVNTEKKAEEAVREATEEDER